MSPRLLILETSHQPGLVALAEGDRVLSERQLDQARRHARDLAPALASLLADQGWKARDLEGIIVSRGPGSYTGLRVGIMSAKTLAYAVGCRLLAMETFAAIARQAPAVAERLDVIADAQQGKVYIQRFQRDAATTMWIAMSALAIVPLVEWVKTLAANVWVSGPGLEIELARLPGGTLVVPETDWRPSAASLLAIGLERWQRGERDDPFAVEPLYLRASSAEEKWGQPR